MDSKKKLGKKCKICNKLLLDSNKTGYCNNHRPRSGKNNPFYGKKHDKETLEKARIKCSKASKKLWENKEYRDKVISGTSKPRSKLAKQNISKAIKKSYENNPQLKILRRNKMLERIENGYDPTNNRIKKNSCGWGTSGYYNNIYYASKLELNRIKYLLINDIEFKRFNKKYIGESIKYKHPIDNIMRHYFPDFIINNEYIEEVKYTQHIDNVVLEKYKEAFTIAKKYGYKYYIVSEKEINKNSYEIYNSKLNNDIRIKFNLSADHIINNIKETVDIISHMKPIYNFKGE